MCKIHALKFCWKQVDLVGGKMILLTSIEFTVGNFCMKKKRDV